MKTNSLLCVLFLLCLIPMTIRAEESGPDIVLVAEAANPQPEALPTIRVQKEKLWGKYYPMVSVSFPNLPEFQCDSWCYESPVDFLDARAINGGAVEMRHRDQNNPQALVVTLITPISGAVLLEARMALDSEGHAGEALPESPSALNLCWQLRHAPDFASAPETYPEFVKRCFIFTDRGRTFLLDTERTKIPVQAPDHEYNNPPWVQSYVAVWQPVPESPDTSWAGYSPDRYLTPVIGTVSRDGQYLAAIANGSTESMAQAWHDCMHNNPKWLPEDAPIENRRWKLAIYAMPNDPAALLERVAKDFPGEAKIRHAAKAPEHTDGWTPAATRGGWLLVNPKATWEKSLPSGPFVRLDNGGILGVKDIQMIESHDEGNSWESRPINAGADLRISSERAILRSTDGTIVLCFLNMTDYYWKWNAETSLPDQEAALDVWSVRSTDQGQTWTDAQVIYEGYSGDLHHMIQTRSDRIVAPVQVLLYEEGRHAIQPRYSDDSGKTWQRSNLLDIGGRGHHDGLIEPTLAERADGRLWMLCRTNLGQFWSAWSENNGEDFRVFEPSGIPASSAPGTLTRLASGRLMLAWNRPAPDGATDPPEQVMRGGDNQWSDERVSNYRAEVSVAFSEDDGDTWSTPTVLVRHADNMGASLAYCYVFEASPGLLWLTTMQGDLRIAFREEDFR